MITDEEKDMFEAMLQDIISIIKKSSIIKAEINVENEVYHVPAGDEFPDGFPPRPVPTGFREICIKVRLSIQ
jgi:hypothetical protein